MENTFKSQIIITVSLGKDAQIEDGKVIIYDKRVKRKIDSRTFSFSVYEEGYTSLLKEMRRFNGTKGIVQINANLW